MTHALLMLALTVLAAPPERHALGLKMPTSGEYKRFVGTGADFQKFAKGFKGITPPRADVTNVFPKPDPKGQGRVGSCVSWAVGYGMKSWQEAVENRWTADSDARRFSPSFLYNQREDRPDPGMNIEDAIAILIRSGCPTLDVMPYQEKEDGDPPDDAAFEAAAPYQISGFMALDPCSTERIKLVLASGYPVVIGINVDKNFDRIQKGEVYRDYDVEYIRQAHENKEGTGHAICIVGYDDDLGAFRLQNSWGTEWADDGYCWVAYEVFDRPLPWDLRFCKMAFTLYDAPTVRLETKVQPSGEVGGRTAYAWEISANAPAETMNALSSVTYRLAGEFDPAIVRRQDAASRFALASSDLNPSTSASPVTLEAELTTRTGLRLRRMVTVPCGRTPAGRRPVVRGGGGTVAVPDLSGRSPADAALRLIGLGLKPKIQHVRQGTAALGASLGRVARQSPGPNATVAKGTTVYIYVDERP